MYVCRHMYICMYAYSIYMHMYANWNFCEMSSNVHSNPDKMNNLESNKSGRRQTKHSVNRSSINKENKQNYITFGTTAVVAPVYEKRQVYGRGWG